MGSTLEVKNRHHSGAKSENTGDLSTMQLPASGPYMVPFAGVDYDDGDAPGRVFSAKKE